MYKADRDGLIKVLDGVIAPASKIETENLVLRNYINELADAGFGVRVDEVLERSKKAEVQP